MTRDDDNYEEKVRKFVEEASKYRKDRKAQEEKTKKKDRKKSKKSKSSKKKKKEKKSKSGKKDKDELDNLELREALKYDFLLLLFFILYHFDRPWRNIKILKLLFWTLQDFYENSWNLRCQEIGQ